MDQLSITPTAISLILLATIAAYFVLRPKSSKPPYPPGPKGLPFLGNSLDLPREKEWVTYSNWAKEYGRIVSVNHLGQRIVLLNDADLERELFDSRGAIYSDRLVPPMIKLMGLEWIVGLMKPDTTWRKCRKIMLRLLSRNDLAQYHPCQQRQMHILLRRLMECPEDHFESLHRFQSAIMLSILYGHEVPAYGTDAMLEMHDASLKHNHKGLNGMHLVNIFPFLRYFPEWLPGMGFHAIAKTAKILGDEFLNRPSEIVYQNPTKYSSAFVLQALEEDETSDKGAQFLLKASAATAYNAGVDTTRSVVAVFVLCMALFPEVQRKAQEAVDQITGGKRLPEFSDRDHMPYIEALRKECARFHPTVPFGLPHQNSKTDIVDGYVIPKDSVVMTNIWYIAHDPKRYKDPSNFRPERFLGENPEPPTEIFGYGRRSCPGKWLAESTLWYSMASILSVFDIGPEIDKNGEKILPKVEFDSGVLSEPVPFKCTIKPRSPAHALIIQQAQLNLS